jgi:HTH-type transcriptional regulator / antitoxin HipB
MSTFDDIGGLSSFVDFARMSSSGDTMRIQTPADLGLTIRERRKQLRLAQQALADRVGVSRQWIVEVEAGKPRAEIGLLLRTLRDLGLSLDASTDVNSSASARSRAAAPNLDAIVERFRSKGK